jgi:hypothetical protein
LLKTDEKVKATCFHLPFTGFYRKKNEKMLLSIDKTIKSTGKMLLSIDRTIKSTGKILLSIDRTGKQKINPFLPAGRDINK